jgi:hypothetical protein
MTARWKRLKASESVSDAARQPAGDLIENKPGGPDSVRGRENRANHNFGHLLLT